MAVPTRRQARAASRASRTTASSMARSRNSTAASSRYYASSRQYDQTSSYVSGSYYDSHHLSRDTWERDTWEELPPSMVDTGSNSSSSVNTYDSAYSDDKSSESHNDSDNDHKDEEDSAASPGIPPSTLPPYNCMPNSEISVRSSDPETFARLFPSMDRLSIRHDDRTADGNMNLRVDAIVPDVSSRRRRAVAIQLFHLRMHDLAKREFSLRRYCRDSGREVCNSKGANPRLERPTASSSSLSKSVTSALRSVKTSFRRSSGASAEKAAALSASTTPDPRRPSFGSNNTSWGCGGSIYSEEAASSDSDEPKLPSARPIPLNTLKLEFSNYARVDIMRRLGKQYDFQWWGHNYAWRRVMDKALGKTAFHLIRDKEIEPVAIILPEGRSPTQVEADQAAGNWIPQCYMWINDKSIIEALTDVADVIIATGLMALVDDSILSRWPPAKKAGTYSRPVTPARPHTAPSAATTATAAVGNATTVNNHTVSVSQPRTKMLVHGLLNKAQTFSPLRLRGHTVLAY